MGVKTAEAGDHNTMHSCFDPLLTTISCKLLPFEQRAGTRDSVMSQQKRRKQDPQAAYGQQRKPATQHEQKRTVVEAAHAFCG